MSDNGGDCFRPLPITHYSFPMKDTLKAGLTYQFRFKVPDSKTVPALYPESEAFQQMPQVLATGYMVGLMEWACIEALRPHRAAIRGRRQLPAGCEKHRRARCSTRGRQRRRRQPDRLAHTVPPRNPRVRRVEPLPLGGDAESGDARVGGCPCQCTGTVNGER